jgi:hypothetical protein
MGDDTCQKCRKTIVYYIVVSSPRQADRSAVLVGVLTPSAGIVLRALLWRQSSVASA